MGCPFCALKNGRQDLLKHDSDRDFRSLVLEGDQQSWGVLQFRSSGWVVRLQSLIPLQITCCTDSIISSFFELADGTLTWYPISSGLILHFLVLMRPGWLIRFRRNLIRIPDELHFWWASVLVFRILMYFRNRTAPFSWWWSGTVWKTWLYLNYHKTC